MRFVAAPLLIAALSLPVRAGAPDPIDLMKRAAEAFDENRRRAVNYLYREVIGVRQLDRKGNIVFEDSRTFEIIYLEGETYPKLVARNGKRLSRTEDQAENVKAHAEAERRRGKPLELRRTERGPERDRAQIAYDRIADLHHVTFEGEAVIENRPAYILTAEPKPNANTDSEVDNYTHSLRLKMWIDRETNLFHRIEALSLRGAWKRPAGNILRIDFIPFDPAVWLVKRVYQRAPLGRDARPAIHQETEQLYSDFRRFQADSKLVPLEQ